MDLLLTRINESISAVDVQLEFERMVATCSRYKRAGGSNGAVISAIGEFLRLHSATDMQAEYIVDTLSALLSSPGPDADFHEVVDRLVTLSSTRGRICVKLVNQPTGSFSIWPLLQHEDEFVKLGCIKLVRNLLIASPSVVFSQMQSRPDVLADLVDLTRAGMSSAFVRSETVSLLFEVSRVDDRRDIAPILAYQGIAESIFSLLMEDEHGVVVSEVSMQAITCLKNLCLSSQCCRYIRESGGCAQVTAFFEIAMAPILDHARGVSSEDDPETEERKIQAGWQQASRVLEIAELLVAHVDSPEAKAVFLSNGLVHSLVVCGESLSLPAEARAACFRFIGFLAKTSAKTAEFFISPDSAEPVLWTLFRVMTEERTPLLVRAAIDSVVAAVCESSESVQQRLAAMLGPVVVDPTDVSEDPLGLYVAESPSKMASAILEHAAENVQFRILDDSPLALQVWFSLTAVSYMTRGNVELQRAVANMRMTENASMLSLLKRLVLNCTLPLESPETSGGTAVVRSGALSLLAELVWALPVTATTVMDIELSKVLTDAVCDGADSIGSGIAAMFLGLLLSIAPEGPVGSVLAAVEGKIGLVKFFALIEGLVKPQGAAVVVPCITPGFSDIATIAGPAVKKLILDKYLEVVPVDSERQLRAVIEAKRMELAELRAKLVEAEKTAVDLSVSVHASHEFVVMENQRLRALVNVLKREGEIGETEIARLKLKFAAEEAAMKSVILDLNQQVHALLVTCQQSTELTGGAAPSRPSSLSDANDLLDLLRVIREGWPETASLIGPLGAIEARFFDPPSSSSPATF